MSLQPLIKVIPSNPSTNSILIVYCYVNNKTVQCQAKWTRIQTLNSEACQNRSSRSQLNVQIGNTYKCTPLDYNHVIQVVANCEYLGKLHKLTTRTQHVKATKQLIDKRDEQKSVLCKIANANAFIECRIGLQMNRVLQVFCGQRKFNLQLSSSNTVACSNYSFKAGIHTHRYEFLTFFYDFNQSSSVNNYQLTTPSLFEFIFTNQFDKDVVLLKVAEMSTIGFETGKSQKSHSMTTKVGTNPSKYLTSVAMINLQLKKQNQGDKGDEQLNVKTKRSINQTSTRAQKIKKQGLHYFKTPDPKSSSVPFQGNLFSNNIERNLSKIENDLSNNKIDKIKISEQIAKRTQTQNSQQYHQEITNKSNDILIFDPTNLTPSQFKASENKQINNDKQFLNIFDDQEGETQVKMQSSSPEFFGSENSKQRPLTNYKSKDKSQTKKDEIPSINLRGSFEQLQKYAVPSSTSVPSEGKSNKKGKEKIKTQINRDLSCENINLRQKTEVSIKAESTLSRNQLIRTPPPERANNEIDLQKQISKLKLENIELHKDLSNMQSILKENSSLKKKYYHLNEQISRLEMERKQILSDKLKCESNYHKQKMQKQQLKVELEEMIKLLQKHQDNRQEKAHERKTLNVKINNQFFKHQYQDASSSNITTFKREQKPRNHQQSINPSLERALNNSGGTVSHNALKVITNGSTKEQHDSNKLAPQTGSSYQVNNRKAFLNNLKEKSFTSKHILNNQDISDTLLRAHESNTQSRKQLRFPSYSYKYSSNNDNK